MGNPYEPLPLMSTPFRSSSSRRSQDNIWAIALLIVYSLTLGGSFIAYKNINPQFFEINTDYLNDPTNCPSEAHLRKLFQEDKDFHFDANEFFSHVFWWLIVSVILSIAVALGLLRLIQHHADKLTKATIGFQLSIPIIMSLGLFFSGNLFQGLFAAGLAAISFAVFYYWRNEISVASKLLSVAGHGLAANASLIGVTIGLNILAVFVALPPFLGLFLGFAVGDVIPNPIRTKITSDVCFDDAKNAIPCCVWQPTPWASFFILMSIISSLWTLMTFMQVKVYTISGTIAQWYFTPSGTPTTGFIQRSLHHAVTSSFGTNAFAGLVLTFTNLAKSQSESDQQSGNASLMSFLLSCLASIYEYLTKFATVMASITGEGLMDAGRRATTLLANNFLDAFATTIWFPSAVVSLASFTLSLVYGTSIWAGYKYLHHPDSQEQYSATNAVVLGVTAGAIALFVLSFLASIVLNSLDAVFICFALDKERNSIANAEIYEALLDAAHERGVVVEGPDGELGYGDRRHVYQPPTVS